MLDIRRGLLGVLFEEEWDACWSIVVCGDGVAKSGETVRKSFVRDGGCSGFRISSHVQICQARNYNLLRYIPKSPPIHV